jgi:two-component system alkaline phosphatase synthesis response regulator PhoP
MAKKILVVDDKKELRALLKQYLSQEGFDIVQAEDGQQALYVLRQEKPDLIILDLMMPEMGGYEFMRAYSREGDAPIIILTAKLDENDKVLGLELGADDYITKPFSMRELTARVRAVLRRAEKGMVEQDILRVADISLDRTGRVVAVAGDQVNLTPSEFDILATLMAAPGAARAAARRGIRRLRAYDRRAHPQPASKDRARPQPAALRRDGVRRRI